MPHSFIFLSLLCLPHQPVEDYPPDTLSLEKTYFMQMASADESSFKREFEYPFRTLLEPEEDEAYRELKNHHERKRYIVSYWQAQNPNPILAQNDFLLGFLQRLEYVKEHYAVQAQPYFDDRGKYYLKYGAPSNQFIQGPQYRPVTFLNMEGGNLRIFIRHKLQGRLPDKFYRITANETWVYKWNSHLNLKETVVHFVAEGEKFVEVRSLEKAITSVFTFSRRVWCWADLMKERIAVLQSSQVTETVEEIFALEDLIVAAYLGSMPVGSDASVMDKVNMPHLKFIHQQERDIFTGNSAKTLLPSSIYKMQNAVHELVFLSDVTQFQGTRGRTRLNISVFTPMNPITDAVDVWNRRDSLRLAYTALFQDSLFQRGREQQRIAVYPKDWVDHTGLNHLVGHLSLHMKVNTGQLTVQVKDVEDNRLGFEKQPMRIRDFTGSELMISDIQICRETPQDCHPAIPVSRIQNVNLMPYPHNDIDTDHSMTGYFEIYNIITSGMVDAYTMTIRMNKSMDKRNVFQSVAGMFSKRRDHTISVTHTRPVVTDHSHEVVNLDLSRLETGPYIMEVEVKDTQHDYIHATVQKSIVLR